MRARRIESSRVDRLREALANRSAADGVETSARPIRHASIVQSAAASDRVVSAGRSDFGIDRSIGPDARTHSDRGHGRDDQQHQDDGKSEAIHGGVSVGRERGTAVRQPAEPRFDLHRPDTGPVPNGATIVGRSGFPSRRNCRDSPTVPPYVRISRPLGFPGDRIGADGRKPLYSPRFRLATIGLVPGLRPA